MIRMEDAGLNQSLALFGHFMALARRVGPAILDRRPVGALDRGRYALGDLIIYGPLRNVLGLSRIRVGYTAGEAIGPEIFAFYRALGINLKQLYGQTEASVFITQQPDGEVRADTVGVASPGVELRIAESGEVFYLFARRLRRILPEPGEHRRDQGRRGLGRHRRRRLHRPSSAGTCGSSTGPRTWAAWPTAACSPRNTSRTR